MNLAEIVILAALVLAVFLALRRIFKMRMGGCSCCCARCGKACGAQREKGRKAD